MRLEDVIAANSHTAGQAVRLHQGVVGYTGGPLPQVLVAGETLTIPALGTVAPGDVVQILSAGDRWLILGTVSAGSAPNLLPTDGWQNMAGSGCPAVRTRFSISSDAAQPGAVLGSGGAIVKVYSDQGDELVRGAGTLATPAIFAQETQSKNHYAMQFGPGGQWGAPYSDDLGTKNRILLPLEPGGTVRMWCVARVTRAAGQFGTNEFYFYSHPSVFGPGDCGPNIQLDDSDTDGTGKLTMRWACPTGSPMNSAYVRLDAINVWNTHVYEGEFNLGTHQIRMWVDNNERAPDTTEYVPNYPTDPVIEELYAGDHIAGGFLNHSHTRFSVLEWIVETGFMSDSDRADLHASLKTKYVVTPA